MKNKTDINSFKWTLSALLTANPIQVHLDTQCVEPDHPEPVLYEITSQSVTAGFVIDTTKVQQADLPKSVAEVSALQMKFDNLVREWKSQTGGLASTTRRYAHPSYQSILIEFGKADGAKLILRELQKTPDWWFEALRLLTGENPTKPGDSFQSARKAWLEWGRASRLI